VLTGTLSTIAEKAIKAGVTGPAIIIIGSVVRLHEKLDWYAPEEQARAGKSARPTRLPVPKSTAS
jgi:uroporphyrin-III C-methyltransferase/precorrin-2 dehydrogenase/sirohydrochlorin ferrochelatase